MEVLNLLTSNKFLLSSSKILQKPLKMSPKFQNNHPKPKFSISFHVSRRSIRSGPNLVSVNRQSLPSFLPSCPPATEQCCVPIKVCHCCIIPKWQKMRRRTGKCVRQSCKMCTPANCAVCSSVSPAKKERAAIRQTPTFKVNRYREQQSRLQRFLQSFLRVLLLMNQIHVRSRCHLGRAPRTRFRLHYVGENFECQSFSSNSFVPDTPLC